MDRGGVHPSNGGLFSFTQKSSFGPRRWYGSQNADFGTLRRRPGCNWQSVPRHAGLCCVLAPAAPAHGLLDRLHVTGGESLGELDRLRVRLQVLELDRGRDREEPAESYPSKIQRMTTCVLLRFGSAAEL